MRCRLKKRLGLLSFVLCLVLVGLVPVTALAEDVGSTSANVLVNGDVIMQPFEVKMAIGVPYEFVFYVEGAAEYQWVRCAVDALNDWGALSDVSTFNASYSGTHSNILKITRYLLGGPYYLKCIAYFDDGSSIESCVINVAPFKKEVGISAYLNQSMVVVYYIINFMSSIWGFICSNPLLLFGFVIVICGFAGCVLVSFLKNG